MSAKRGRLFEHVHFIAIPSGSAPIRQVFAAIASPVRVAERPSAPPRAELGVDVLVALSDEFIDAPRPLAPHVAAATEHDHLNKARAGVLSGVDLDAEASNIDLLHAVESVD